MHKAAFACGSMALCLLLGCFSPQGEKQPTRSENPWSVQIPTLFHSLET
jgi:hypothetical protein